jgi:putative hydrolase of the HAD superfamily
MKFDLIGLDADDTLWHNEIYYRRGRETFNRILAKYGIPEPDEPRVNEFEIANLEFYGYGAIGFALSLAEAAMEMTSGQILSEDLMTLLAISKMIISADVELFEGVETVVQSLSQDYPLMLVTKGNQHHQASKIQRSGLSNYFKHIEIVPDKAPATYAEILSRVSIPTERFVMVGNAMRSDILPVLEIGGSAIYIHNDLTWSHEHADQEVLPQGRFFELETVKTLPEFIRSLES